MKNKIGIVLWVMVVTLFAQDSSRGGLGLKFAAGGRYDDVRMCVSSDAGVKGGTIAEMYLQFAKELTEKQTLLFELPLFRPVFFGAAFKMIQFEPQATWEFHRKTSDYRSFVVAPGLGVSVHYGPGYRSDMDTREDSFWAFGPIISTSFGRGVHRPESRYKGFGVKLFYIPLFSSDELYSSGNVIGATVEYQFRFKKSEK